MVNANTPQLQGYGFVSDSDDSLQTKSGGVFGGNFGNTRLIKFAYNPNTAKEGQPVQEAIEIVVKIVDREYKAWLSPITKVFDNNNTEITDRNSLDFINGYNALVTQQGAVVSHYIKSVGVSEDALKNLLTQYPATSFADYAAKVCSLLPADYANKPLDYFLEYQWSFGKKKDGSPQDVTFLTLPTNMKGGYFVVPAQQGPWTEEIASDKSLTYVNPQGLKHPFDRNANYMSSHKAIQQGNTNNASAITTSNANFTPEAAGNGAAKTSTWTVPTT